MMNIYYELATIIKTHLKMFLLDLENFNVSIIKKKTEVKENDQVCLLTDVRGVS